jgi:hypothetical protein
MTIQLYAVVNPSTTVINMVEWDGVTPFNVAPNTLVSALGQPNAQIGGTYIGGVFTPPSAPAPQQGFVFLNSPVSGATVPLPNPPAAAGAQELTVVLEPATTLATLTLTMPTAQVNDGTVVTLYSTHAVTALTLTGATVNNAPASLAALTQYNIQWSQQYGVWFHLGPSA